MLIIIALIVASVPTNLTLDQEDETTITVSWTSPAPIGTSGYRLYWVTCGTNEHNEICINASTTTKKKLTSLIKEECYNISVAGVSQHLPSEIIHSAITLG